VLVVFDKYEGPHLFEDIQGRSVISTKASKREFITNNITYTRTQLLLTIAFAITVYKSQGITIDKIVTNITKKDYITGLSYVAISRIKT